MADDLRPLRLALGDLLRVLRTDAGLTQKQLGERVGYARVTVATAESGHRSPTKDFWARADVELAADGRLVGGYDQLHAARVQRDRQRVQRAEADRAARVAQWRSGAALPEPSSDGTPLALPHDAARGNDHGDERAAAVRQSRRQADTEREGVVQDLEHREVAGRELGVVSPARDSAEAPRGSSELRDTLAALRRAEDEVGSAPVLGVTLSITRLTETLLRAAAGPARQKLLGLAGQHSQFVAWLYKDLGRHDLALGWYRRCGEQAREAGDPDLVSTVLSMRSHLSWSERDARSAVALAEGALLVPGIAPVVRSQAAQQFARALAMAGEAGGIDRYLDLAEDLAHQAAAEPERIPPWLYFHDVSRVAVQRGVAYVEAGRGEDAARVLQAWIDRTPAEHVRDRGWNYGRLALAHAMSADAEAALEAAHRAVDISLRAPSAHTAKDLRQSARLLRRTGAATAADEVRQMAQAIAKDGSL